LNQFKHFYLAIYLWTPASGTEREGKQDEGEKERREKDGWKYHGIRWKRDNEMKSS